MGNQVTSSISKEYAAALISVAKDNGSIELYKSQLCEISEIIKMNPDMHLVFDNSSISCLKKQSIIKDIFKDKIDEKLLNFLLILTEKNRFNELENIVNIYENMVQDSDNIKKVEIISAIDLEPGYKEKIKKRLEERLNCGVIPVWQVDSSIIAGLIFKYDNYIADMSVSAKLKDLSTNLLR